MLYESMFNHFKDERSLSLFLTDRNIGQNDAQSLARALKDPQITKLNLEDNNVLFIGCDNLKYLAEQLLQDNKITNRNLKNNEIADDEVKQRAQDLINKQISGLDLSENKLGNTAQRLLEILSTKLKRFELHVYSTNAKGNINIRLSLKYTCYRDDNKLSYLTLHGEICIKCAHFINNVFRTTGITMLKFDEPRITECSKHLAQAFKGIKIGLLWLSYHSVQCGVKYLIEAFKDSQIIQLMASSQITGAAGARLLAEFLKEVNVLNLYIAGNRIGDEGMKCLAPALRNNDVMELNLSSNDIEAEGARYLSEILRTSKIHTITLSNNTIGVDGARYLACGLQFSQVTRLHLLGKDIKYAGYQYLKSVVDDTNMTHVHLYWYGIEGLDDKVLYPDSIPRNTISVAEKLVCAFEHLVTLDPKSGAFEFTAPRKKTYPPVGVDQYAFLIRTLKYDPNSKVHIFKQVCEKKNFLRDYDINTMDKINKFITTMPNKFNTFIDNKLPDLVKSFGIVGVMYANLVKQFEEMGLYVVVENLLLHRVLYYVDENQEILHPFIYKMLDKYHMPLYNIQLEPNKKDEIISYYHDHQEIDGAQEIIDLLRSRPSE